MSKDIWGDEPFRDGQQEFNNGKWQQPETYAPVPETTIKAARALQQKQAEETEQEYDIEELTEQVADEDDDDFTEVLSDARLRLEQGKLYEMVMNHDLFGGVEADPRAAKSVQKQIRKFAKEQMEVMLGMRQEATIADHIPSQFSSLQAQALRDIANKLITSKGMKEEDYPEEEIEQTSVQAPKKKTLNTIGSRQVAKSQPKPITRKAEPIKRQTKPRPQLPPEFEPDYIPLDKPLHEMTAQELAARDKQALERQRDRKAALPSDRAPMPDFATQEMLALSQVSRATNTSAKGNLSGLIVANLKASGKI